MANQNHENRERKKVEDGALVGFSPVSSPRIFWKSRKRSSSVLKNSSTSTSASASTSITIVIIRLPARVC
uniref:Uncharacterized protein n=1 Tax=Quercus lobata TaxID=97700 RepID=A0A7N2LQL5_QUELO